MAEAIRLNMPPRLQSFFLFCGVAYIAIYTLEGVVRYGLSFAGADSAILARDLLMWLPLLALLMHQSFRQKVELPFLVYAAVIAIHGGIIYLNFRTTIPVIYGAKLLINILFGFVAGAILTHPSRRVLRVFIFLWFTGVIGLMLEKFFFSMPWVGMSASIGGITVDVARNWDIVDPLAKRVAGFTRSSISAAAVFPILALIIAVRTRSWMLKAFVLLVTAGAVFATTQKGSLVAFMVVLAILLAPKRWHVTLLRITCLAFVLLLVALPIVTPGLMMTTGGGVFSMMSFAMRFQLTWPEAWSWVSGNEVFPFGVGLGGIGGPQRFFAPDFFNPSDNLFVFMYANFGVLAFVYLGAICTIIFRIPRRPPPEAMGALATLTFLMGYGAVLSMIEDQMSALFIGAAAGVLWQMRVRHNIVKQQDVLEPQGKAVVLAPAYARQSTR